MTTEAPGRVEQHTIFPIPRDQRHGTSKDLFTIWFGSNLMMLTIITGSLATAVFKLDFTSSCLAILIGNLVGAIFMALHAAQGPQLGVPQMVQTRGQFGTLGAVLVVALVIIMYVGFLASNIVLAGQSLHTIAKGVDEHWFIILVAVVSVVATIFGHDLIHAYVRVISWASGLALLATFLWIVFAHGLPGNFMSMNSYNMAGFFSMISVAALWQIAYAPYVSDYSRYLPYGTGAKQAFWSTYWGCSLGSILPMVLGAMLGLVAANGDPVAGLTTFTGAIAVPVVIIFSIGIAGTNAMNLYCGVLSTITLIHTFIPNWHAKYVARMMTAIAITVVGLVIALFAAGNFLTTYTNFILLLLYILVPWTAINLVDFYLVRHGDYDVDAFFTAEGGIYGRFNKGAIFCYFLGILIQLPFVSTDLYTGPIAKMLHGVDLSWIVGLCVISPIYYFIAKRHTANKTLPNAA